MPPKKKAPAKATSKKAPAKRPVGRPRKPLGTRVSDVDLLANVGSTKPMPRRVGRDALEQQRARLRYAVDYPGRRFTERMTRALQDSFATGALPYGVSLRAPANFVRPYETTFEPIAGMPVWPAINVPPNAEAEDALRLIDAARAAASAAPDPAVRPTKRAKRSGVPILASLSGLNPGTSYVRDPNDTSEVYVPDTSVADRQAANRENMNKLAFQWMDQRQRELAEVRSASLARRRREGQIRPSQAIQDMNEELRRQNAAVASFPALGLDRPPMLRSEQERILQGLPPGRKKRAAGPELPPPPPPSTRPSVSVYPTQRPIGTLTEPSTSVLRLRRENLVTPEMQAIADQLAPHLFRRKRKPLVDASVPTSQVLRLRQADTTPVLRLKGPAPPPNVLRLQGPAFDTRDIRAADAAIARDERARKSAIKERAKNLGELLSQRPSPAQPIEERAKNLGELLSRRPPPPPTMTQEETENAFARAVAINEQIDQIDQALKTQPGRGIANLLGMQRQTLEDTRASIIDPGPAYTLTFPSLPPPPPPQNIMVGVPDPVREDEYLNNLRQAEQEEEKRLTRLRAGRSIAEAQLNLAYLRGLIRDRVAEVSRLTPSSEPAPASVPQSIVVPGTEAPAVIPSNQEAAFQRASQDANDRRRLEEENARLREVNRLQELAMERAASSLQAQEQLRANEAAASQADPSLPRLVAKPPEMAEAQTYVDSLDLIRRASTKRDPSGPRVGTVDAKIARGEPVSLEDRQRNFERTVDANQRAEELLRQEKPKLEDVRAVRRLVHLGPEQKQNLDELIALRTNQPPPVRVPREPPLPPIVTAETLARPPMVPFSGQVSINPDVLVAPVSNPDPPQTVRIPPQSNPPEPSSQGGPATGSGLQHVTAATFPSSKWTTASSLRWLRSNGLHPIRKSTKINGSYSYALQSPAGYSSFNSVKMSHKNKDFTIVYGTPK